MITLIYEMILGSCFIATIGYFVLKTVEILEEHDDEEDEDY